MALLVPDPCCLNNVVNLGIVGLPAEFVYRLLAGGDEEGGITGAAGADFDWDRVAGHSADGVDHLLDGKSGAVAQVVNEPLLCGLWAFKGFKGKEMRVGKIGDMDVVADAGAVGGRVVLAKDLDGVATPQGHVQDQGNEVR